QRLVRTTLGGNQVLLAALGGGQAIGNLLLTLGHRTLEVRPDVLHRDPDEETEPNGLGQQCSVDIHASLLFYPAAGINTSLAAIDNRLTLNQGDEGVGEQQV